MRAAKSEPLHHQFGLLAYFSRATVPDMAFSERKHFQSFIRKMPQEVFILFLLGGGEGRRERRERRGGGQAQKFRRQSWLSFYLWFLGTEFWLTGLCSNFTSLPEAPIKVTDSTNIRSWLLYNMDGSIRSIILCHRYVP